MSLLAPSSSSSSSSSSSPPCLGFRSFIFQSLFHLLLAATMPSSSSSSRSYCFRCAFVLSLTTMMLAGVSTSKNFAADSDVEVIKRNHLAYPCGSLEYSSSNHGFLLIRGGTVDNPPILFYQALDLCEETEWKTSVKKKYCSLKVRKLKLSSSNQHSVITKEERDRILEEEKEEDHSGGGISVDSKGVAMALPAAFLLCCAIICPCFRSRKKQPSEEPDVELINKDHPASPFNGSTVSDGTWAIQSPHTPREPRSPPRFVMQPKLNKTGSMHLSLNQIIKATQNFAQSYVIGEGGFGTVYKAELPNGQVVAIKRARKEHASALIAEFSNEIQLLTQIEHRNLVSLLGYIDKGNERIIISEYIPNGTLREHLDCKQGKVLDFSQRLEIAIDIAHALTYLHLYTERPVIHRDVKSSNILLTEQFRAKVSDFGFAKIASTEEDQSAVITAIKGTAGYVDPEYMKTLRLTPKSDVFSYGVLLLEILSARRPYEAKRNRHEKITIRWAFDNFTQGKMRDILDPLLEEVVYGEVLRRLFGLAFECAAPTRADRPTMKQVVENLWEIRKEYATNRRST